LGLSPLLNHSKFRKGIIDMIKTTLGSIFTGIQAPARKPSTSKNREVGNRVKRAGALAAAATTLALGLTLAPIQAQTAAAFDLSSCVDPAPVIDIDSFRINTATLDFGGAGGLTSTGSPKDDAIVCWDKDRKWVQLRGTMYLDNIANNNDFKGCVRITLRFEDTAGGNVAEAGTDHDLCDANGRQLPGPTPANYTFNAKRFGEDYDKPHRPPVIFNKVHVWGYQKSNAVNSTWQLVAEKHLRFGDPD
jgi:hypothetical protein